MERFSSEPPLLGSINDDRSPLNDERRDWSIKDHQTFLATPSLYSRFVSFFTGDTPRLDSPDSEYGGKNLFIIYLLFLKQRLPNNFVIYKQILIFQGKTIGLLASIFLIINNITGPGLPSLPLIFQNAGWVMYLVFFFFHFLFSFCLFFLIFIVQQLSF